MEKRVAIIGAGLAGSEIAWQLAIRGVQVSLYEMRPKVTTEAHRTDNPAELVCSNSFKSIDLANAHGLLKAELRAAGSLIMEIADQTSVPAGAALAVDRDIFSGSIKDKLLAHRNITYHVEEITRVESLLSSYDYVVIAAGPLCSTMLSENLHSILGDEGLYFYDAISPVVFTESIDMNIAYRASRYNKGDADYINCPMSREAYFAFINDLKTSEKVPFNAYERSKHFEGCLPIEVMAERGADTLAFGPLKPVGLDDPRTGERPYAVLQLRQENKDGSLYNLVGCQTRMTWPEQRRVFREVPGLENCEFARLGSMHRNTYIQAPKHLLPDLSVRSNDRLFLAGQITGVEGYSESTAMGMWAAMNLFARLNEDVKPTAPQPKCMIGGLVNYLMTASPDNFQPMNANFGLLDPPPGKKIRNKKEKRQIMASAAVDYWAAELRRTNWMEFVH